MYKAGSFAIITQGNEQVKTQPTVFNKFCKWVEKHTKRKKAGSL